MGPVKIEDYSIRYRTFNWTVAKRIFGWALFS
jgi:hypothetical protein